MKITFFGSGYVGPVSGACPADVGRSAVCIDIGEKKIDLLNRCISSIYEPECEGLILNNPESGRLSFSTDAANGVWHG